MADPRDELVTTLRDAAGGTLRDVWLFDETGHESLYLREDVAQRVTELNVERYIDNERYGYVTRETWESLHYTDYAFTIRGFGEFLQYRTFLDIDDRRVGLLASFDTEADVDFPTVTQTLVDAVDGTGIAVAVE